MLFRICLVLFILCSAYRQPFAQDLQRIVSVNYKNHTLRSILTEMESDFGLKFSYVPQALPLDSILTLALSGQPLKILLDRLSEQAGLEYKIVGDHIALYYFIPLAEKTGELMGDAGDQKVSASVIEDYIQDKPLTRLSEVSGKAPHPGLIGIPQVAPPEAGNLAAVSVKPAEEGIPGKRNRTVRIGPVFSVDFLKLAAAAEENKGFVYRGRFNYSAGISAKLKLATRASLLLQILYATKNFEQVYRFQIADPHDPNVPHKTVYELTYLEIPIATHFTVLGKKRLKAIGAVGFVSGFLLNRNNQTYLSGGMQTDTPEFLDMEILPRLCAFQVGLETSYAIHPRFTINLSAGWRRYFNGISKDPLTAGMELFQCAGGIYLNP